MKAKLNGAGRHLKFSFHPSGINAAESSSTSHTPTSQSCFPSWASAAHAGLLASLSAGGCRGTWHLQGLPRPEGGTGGAQQVGQQAAKPDCCPGSSRRELALGPRVCKWDTSPGVSVCVGGRGMLCKPVSLCSLALLSAVGQKFVCGSLRSSYDICKTPSILKPDFQEEDLLGSKSSSRSQRGCKFFIPLRHSIHTDICFSLSQLRWNHGETEP